MRTKLLAEFRSLLSVKLAAQLTAVLCKCRLNTLLKMMKEDTIEIVGFHAHIYFNRQEVIERRLPGDDLYYPEGIN